MELGPWYMEYKGVKPGEIYYADDCSYGSENEYYFVPWKNDFNWTNYWRKKNSSGPWQKCQIPMKVGGKRSHKVGTGQIAVKNTYHPTNNNCFYYVTVEGQIQNGIFKADNPKHLVLLSMKNCFETKWMAELYTPKIIDKYKKITKKKVSKI